MKNKVYFFFLLLLIIIVGSISRTIVIEIFGHTMLTFISDVIFIGITILLMKKFGFFKKKNTEVKND